jgi:hypothetical protein
MTVSGNKFMTGKQSNFFWSGHLLRPGQNAQEWEIIVPQSTTYTAIITALTDSPLVHHQEHEEVQDHGI